MKRHILAAAAAVILACSATYARWNTTVHDFGAFDEDLGAVNCTFEYINDSPEAVAIVSARASCGCTSPKYPREAIAPGDTARVVVTYDPSGRPGRFTKYVGVTLSDGTPMQKLYVKGTVVGSAASVAQRFPADCGSAVQLARGAVMAGEIVKGQMRTTFLEGYNRSTDTIVPRVEGLPSYITVTPTPGQVPPGEQFTLIFYVHTGKTPLYGLVTDTVTVAANADGTTCDIPVVAIIKEDFSRLSDKELAKAPHAHLAATTADFGSLGAGTATRTLTLDNTGRSPLKVRRIYTADPGIDVTIDRTEIKPGRSATITVTVDPSKIPGELLNARISLITNDPDRPTQTLRAVGQ